MFDKTGTLTIGGARLVAIEAAPGQSADEILRMAGSLEQASQSRCGRNRCGGGGRERA
jgi:cation transport ATPase